MGGIRGVKHYMQRTAIQSTPAMIAAISEQYIPGGPKHVIGAHPFRKRMSELAIGDTLKTASRTVTIPDIEHFAEFTGDNFYAHMDEEAAKASPIFEGRVAHGYIILSFAAGLFVVNAVAVVSLSEIAPAALQQHVFWGSLLLGLLLWGPGRWSLDHVLAPRWRARGFYTRAA